MRRQEHVVKTLESVVRISELIYMFRLGTDIMNTFFCNCDNRKWAWEKPKPEGRNHIYLITSTNPDKVFQAYPAIH